MARINIEDELFTDDRWINLVLKLGSKTHALGVVAGAWILAQKHWRKHKMIPEKAWSKEYDVLIEVELATRRADGNVYVKGSKKAFLWLDASVESGRKGGLARSEKKAEAVKNNGSLGGRPKTPAETKAKPLDISDQIKQVENLSDPNDNLSETKGFQPSYSYSPSSSSSSSLSSSNSDSRINTSSETVEANASKKSKKKSSPEKTELNRKIWDSYAQAFSERYRVQPTRNASVNAKISQLGERLGEDAITVVKFFLKHNDGFYLKKIHDIGLCLKDAESLHVQMQRGKAITSQDVRNFERTSNIVKLVNDAKEGGF